MRRTREDDEGLEPQAPPAEPVAGRAGAAAAAPVSEEAEPGAEALAGAAEDPAGEGPSESEPEPPDGGLGPGEERTDEELARSTAALLFAATEPLTAARLRALLERPAAARVRAALEAVAARLEEAGLPIELRAISGGWQLFTQPEEAEVVARLSKARREERVSAAALETLAVVAYRQPVTKAEIEAIRGVQAGPMLRSLVDRGLVRVTGRAEVPGHPLLYGTTRKFLDSFGLGSLKDLPRDGELVHD